MTITQLKQHLQEVLSNTFDARESHQITQQLLEELTQMDIIQIALHPDETIQASTLSKADEYLKRLENGEPLQYVLEKAYFYGMELKVSPAVLIPRPETEELVEWAIEILNDQASANVLDIGTGSGCIACAIKKEKPIASVIGLDVSPSALAIAQSNAQTHQLNIQWQQMDILDSSKWDTLPKQDLIISNPPYIGVEEATQLSTRVIEHEPNLALFAQADDVLIFYRRIAQLAQQKLNKDGHLLVETHEKYAQEVANIFTQNQLKNSIIKKDLQGKDRMVLSCI